MRNKNVYFIAELGQNHQGSLEIAKQMIDALRGSGVSAVKTAKRDIETCLSEEQKNMIYDNPNSFGRTYYEHRKALELSDADFIELKNYAESAGFDFISSFTDKNSFDFLKKIGLTKIKIASSRVADIALLEHVAENFSGDVYLSTGMSDFKMVETAINILNTDKIELSLLQCTSIYPCPDDCLNLKNILGFRRDFSRKIKQFGFSGHHTGIAPDIAAFMLGCSIIERHFTLNRAWKGTDHAASLGVDGIKKILKYIDQVADAVSGSLDKKILPAEQRAIDKLRADL